MGRCIKVSENTQYLLQRLILCPVVTAAQVQDFCKKIRPIFGKLIGEILIPNQVLHTIVDLHLTLADLRDLRECWWGGQKASS